MHHQDFSGDSPGAGGRKTTFHYSRGSSGASASSAAGGTGGAHTADDSQTQTGSSSPALHHQPQSQVSGAQVKKKSGFQITSVTSAQINVSGNNSLADDTESYDDLDESHTEDLSSSDMLDVSMSRATDTGVPERSSSDDTLNSLHGVDTPGIVSPNEPLHPHSTPQVSQNTSMVNGTMHHHYYPQQHSQSHHHHSEILGGESALPIAPLASSSPALASKSGASKSQRTPLLDNTKPAGGITQPLTHIVSVGATDANLQGSANVSNVTAGAAVPPSGSAGFDNTSLSGQVASGGGGTGPSIQAQHPQTHAATGSRFRVVKLDTNSEPFRKGRWTCTEFYEKENPPLATSDAQKGVELTVETEAGSAGISPNVPAVQPPHTLQPYQQPTLDFKSPQSIHSPPQGLTYVSPQEVVSGAHMPKPVASVTLPTATPLAGGTQSLPGISQQFPYAVDPHAGVINPGSVRQPDFIQPTAPFQTQVQHPPLHLTTGLSIVPRVIAQPPVSITHQLSHQGQATPTAPATFAVGQPQALQSQLLQQQVHPLSTATVPVVPSHGATYMPLTALKADLQPLLTPGTTLTQVSSKSSHLEDAQRLLLQHQGLLALPKLAGAASGAGASEVSGAAGTLAHMGMSAEASAFMAAAAAGLRGQHVEGDDDSSSGASVVAIDNKIEQAMDLVKSHLMYAVREEVEVLKEQIKELIERNTQLEQENNLLKNLASPEQMAQFQAQVQTGDSPTGAGQPPALLPAGSTQVLPSAQIPSSSA